MFISKKKLNEIESLISRLHTAVNSLCESAPDIQKQLSSQKEMIDLLAKNAGVEIVEEEYGEYKPGYEIELHNGNRWVLDTKEIKQRLVLKKLKK